MTTRGHGPNDTGGYYFQSSAAQSNSARRAEKAKGNGGRPLKLGAKLSAVLVDQGGRRQEGEGGKEGGEGKGKGEDEDVCIFVADNGGRVRRVELKTNKTTHTYRGPRHPITSLALDPSGTLLFAGCWDNTIWSWDVASGKQRQRYTGHSDFVNCVTLCNIAIPSTTSGSETESGDHALLLISGSVDATIVVWRVSTGERLHTLKGHTRGVLDLAIDPVSKLLPQQHSRYPETIYLLSAASTPEIRSWRITYSSAAETTSTLAGPADDDEQAVDKLDEEAILAPESAPLAFHATSVNKILFSPPSPGASPFEYMLLTASSDNTAQCLTRPIAPRSTTFSQATNSTPKPNPWTSTDTFSHPDWVRCTAHDPATGLLVTGCRDEDVRVWDMSSGECVRTFSGHFESVEGVCIVELQNEKSGGRVKWIVSVSLDGTLRRWRLDGEEMAEEDEDGGDMEGGDGLSEGKEGSQMRNGKSAGGKVVATEEEDQELADLMAELEEDD